MTKPYEQWWKVSQGGDQSMEDSHTPHWQEFIDELPVKNLTGASILNFGCNQGGMLRLLHDQRPFGRAVGIDLATSSIENAQARVGDRPIEYMVSPGQLPWRDEFDFALSFSVMYLLPDMQAHAREMFQVLKPGGAYFASHPDYVGFPGAEKSVAQIAKHASVCLAPNSLDTIAEAFSQAGFQVAVKRKWPKQFIKFDSTREWYNRLEDQLDFMYRHTYIFQFVKPA